MKDKIKKLKDKPVLDWTERDWLIILVKMAFSHPQMSAQILIDSLGIPKNIAASVMAHHMTENIMSFEADSEK